MMSSVDMMIGSDAQDRRPLLKTSWSEVGLCMLGRSEGFLNGYLLLVGDAPRVLPDGLSRATCSNYVHTHTCPEGIWEQFLAQEFC